MKKIKTSTKILIISGGILLALPAWYLENQEVQTNSKQAHHINLETILFTEAKHDLTKRAGYIKNITDSFTIPNYVTNITYSTNQSKSIEHNNIYSGDKSEMSTNLAFGGRWSDIAQEKLYTEIKIFDPAFSNSKNEKEFIMKLNHELNHAKIIYKGFDQISLKNFYFINQEGKRRINTTLLYLILELDSHKKDIQYAIKYGLDQTKLKSTYMQYYSFLWSPNNPTSSEIIAKFKQMFFQDWMKKSFDNKGAYLTYNRTKLRLQK